MMRTQQHSLSKSPKSQRHINLRLERWHRLAVYAAVAWLVLTGLAWLAAHYFMRPVGQFGEGIHPLEPWSMKLHGAGAMIMLFFLGSLMNSHIRRALKAGRNLFTGWAMIAVFLLLIVSGYGLYYLAGESSRYIWSQAHWVIGLLFPLLLILHIAIARASRS